MVVNFSSRQRDLAASVTTTIHGKPVEVVEEYKYLGTIFDNLLKFSANTEEILRRCHQWLYLLRKLNSFGVSTPIMMSFYYVFLERIITFFITCWFHSLSLQNRNRLQHTASVCSKIIGLSELWHRFSANRPLDRQPKSSMTPLTFFNPHFNGSPLGEASIAFPAGLRGGERPLSPKTPCFLTPADKTISHIQKHKLLYTLFILPTLYSHLLT
ncbi:PH-interacting protein [Sarotherodon galilaeus]